MGTSERFGEKLGWVGGWVGSFLWVAILAVVFFFRGSFMLGAIGLLLAFAAYALAMFFAPWRHPATSYWKLMLVPYGMFFLAIGWVIWAFGGIEGIGLNWWNMLWVMPMLGPFGMLGDRKWARNGQ